MRNGILVLLALALVLGATGLFAWKSVHASGKIDYCILEYDEMSRFTAKYILRGHREWRSDAELGRFIEMDTAIEEAVKLNCPFNVNK